jgi:2-methylcitrate dehydratase PrpD
MPGNEADGTLELIRVIEWLLDAASEPLPAQVADAARLLVADSVICGIAAAEMDRTRMSVEAIQPGGPPQAELVTAPTRVRSADAAWVNAEAMNLMDADDTFLNGGHFGSIVSASALAEAQACGATWRDLETAVTLGFDVLARIQLAAAPAHHAVLTPGLNMIGATLAAAAVRRGHASVLDAVGVAMRSALAPNGRQHALAGFDTFKYAPHGLVASQSVVAARLADAGYQARPWSSSGPGVFELQSVVVDGTILQRGLGETWWVTLTSLKPYPSFRLGHAAMDALRLVLDEHAVKGESIERVSVFVDPRAASMPFYQTTPDRFPVGPLAPLHAAFHLRYGLALVALEVPPGPAWSTDPAVANPAVWDLADRIEISGAARDTAWLTARRDTRTGRVHELTARVEVTAGGRTYQAAVDMADGDPWRAETRPDWAWLSRKAANFGVSERIVSQIREAASGAPVGAVYWSELGQR